MLSMTVLSLVLGSLAAWLITRSITTPINQAVRVARSVATGDLSCPIEATSSDEIGQLLQALKNIVADPKLFGIELDPIPNRPYFTTVDGTGAIDVQLAAKLAEMPVDDFIALNPGFNRPLIPGNSDARIVLPADKVDLFHANLENYDQDRLVSWKVYHPSRGESLAGIARKFHVPEAELLRVNGIRSRYARMPATLVVPTDGHAAAEIEKLPIMYAPPIPSGGQVHVVRAGESLWSISRHYGVSVAELRRWNKNVHTIRPGQRLVVYAAPRHVSYKKSTKHSKR